MAQHWQVHSQGLHAGRSAALGHDSCTNLAQNLRKVLCNFLRVLCFADGCDTRAGGHLLVFCGVRDLSNSKHFLRGPKGFVDVVWDLLFNFKKSII